ncbi:MAG: hypothetical protein RLZZ81_1094 [Pseudomonadota bacterium]|jgi:hypothetical protein
MLGYEKEQRSLTKEQKQAVGLLSVGTLLEGNPPIFNHSRE